MSLTVFYYTGKPGETGEIGIDLKIDREGLSILFIHKDLLSCACTKIG